MWCDLSIKDNEIKDTDDGEWDFLKNSEKKNIELKKSKSELNLENIKDGKRLNCIHEKLRGKDIKLQSRQLQECQLQKSKFWNKLGMTLGVMATGFTASALSLACFSGYDALLSIVSGTGFAIGIMGCVAVGIGKICLDFIKKILKTKRKKPVYVRENIFREKLKETNKCLFGVLWASILLLQIPVTNIIINSLLIYTSVTSFWGVLIITSLQIGDLIVNKN